MTNIVIFDIEGDLSANELAGHLMSEHGVRVSVLGDRTVRMVTHLDVDSDDAQYAADAVTASLDELGRGSTGDPA